MLKKLVFLASLFLIFSHSIFAQNQVDLVQDAQKAGISFYWDPMTYTGLLEKNGHRISFRAGDDYCLQDYKKIIPEKAPVMQAGKLVANKTFMNTAENFFKVENVEVPYRIGAVLIDAGHGGKDPGASRVHRINGKNVNVVEKDINLKVAKMLCENLKSAYPDKKILMTRSTDVYLTLQQTTLKKNFCYNICKFLIHAIRDHFFLASIDCISFCFSHFSCLQIIYWVISPYDYMIPHPYLIVNTFF